MTVFLWTTFASLEEEGLLPDILKHVQQLSDLITCSGVTKRWHAACQRVQPLHISIGGEEKLLLRVAGLTGILQWLQRHQMQRDLQEVKGLTLNCNRGYVFECHHNTHVLVFFQSVLTLTDCLLLTSCESFCGGAQEQLEKIVSLLPLTLQSLTLHETHGWSSQIDLSMFARLKSIKAINSDRFSRSFQGSTCILNCKLASLRELVLVPGSLRLSDVSGLAAFLPSLQYLLQGLMSLRHILYYHILA